MAETLISVVATHVNAKYFDKNRIVHRIAAEALAGGDLVYELVTGKVGKAGANTAGKKQPLGVAMRTVIADEAVDVAEGILTGFAVTALDAGATVYLGDTAGRLSSTVGTTTVPVGKVVVSTERGSDGTFPKFVQFVCFSYTNYNA